jgi:hypothetical protein
LTAFAYVEAQYGDRSRGLTDFTSVSAVPSILSDAGISDSDTLVAALLCGNDLMDEEDIAWAACAFADTGVAKLIRDVGATTLRRARTPDAVRACIDSFEFARQSVRYIVLAIEIDRLDFAVHREDAWDAQLTHDHFVLADAVAWTAYHRTESSDVIGNKLLRRLQTATKAEVSVGVHATYRGLPSDDSKRALECFLTNRFPEDGNVGEGAAQTQDSSRKLAQISQNATSWIGIINAEPGLDPPKRWDREPTVREAMCALLRLAADTEKFGMRDRTQGPDAATPVSVIPCALLDELRALINTGLMTERCLVDSPYDTFSPNIRIADVYKTLSYVILDTDNTLSDAIRRFLADMYYALTSRLDVLLARRLAALTTLVVTGSGDRMWRRSDEITRVAIDNRRAAVERYIALCCEIYVTVRAVMDARTRGPDALKAAIQTELLEKRNVPLDVVAYNVFEERLRLAPTVPVGLRAPVAMPAP